MNNYRAQIETLLAEVQHPGTDAVSHTLTGFIAVIQAVQYAGSWRTMYNECKAAGQHHAARHMLLKVEKAEKIADDLLTFWRAELAPASPQTDLFQ